VLRWNEILLGLVARTSTCRPCPMRTIRTPFRREQSVLGSAVSVRESSAPRAYSYVTVAQFDALKAAWSAKYLYNRPAPWRVDSGVKALVPTTDLPAYPSEDAVMSGVNAELLKLLFPAAVEDHDEGGRARRQARCCGQGQRE
jgi:hypothetical protein